MRVKLAQAGKGGGCTGARGLQAFNVSKLMGIKWRMIDIGK
jgi:hypothetical protein